MFVPGTPCLRVQHFNKLRNGVAVVFFLSKDFVTKAWPMKELIESIKRHDAAPGDIALVPIFSPMSLVEVKKIKELYSKDDFWIGKEKPEPSVLLKWEEAFQTLCKFQGFQPSRVSKRSQIMIMVA